MTRPFLYCGALVLGLAAYSCSGDSSTTGRNGAGGAPNGDAGDGGGAAGENAGTAGSTNGGSSNAAGHGGGAGEGGSSAEAGSANGGADSGGEAGSTSGGGEAGSSGEAGAGGEGGGDTCEVGEVQSSGTQQNLDLFGTVVYFDGGAELPAGRYRIDYVDGCMKYGSGQGWTIHAYEDGSYAWWLVGETTSDKIVMPPATIGVFAGQGAFESFEECVDANLEVAPKELDFPGGKLGVWLQDSPYSDNLAGEDNRNPKWKLTLLAPCAD